MKNKIVKIFKQGDSTVMTIPAPIAEMLEIGPGDYVSVSMVGKKIVVEKTAFTEPPKDILK
jgi:AbrB family looped-hinge helix DNA binding protein